MMALELFICPNCGASGDDLLLKDDFFICKICGHRMREDTAKKLEEILSSHLNEEKRSAYREARKSLYTAARREFPDAAEIVQWAREIKKYAPDDVLASFYEAANAPGSVRLCRFLDGFDVAENNDFLEEVVRFSVKILTSESILSVGSLIQRGFAADREAFKKWQTLYEDEVKKIDAETYDADVPRDVFVAYKSEDEAKAYSLVRYLEEECGLTCFFSMRNLQHGKDAPHTYDDRLERAMDACGAVVFVSSKRSRTQGDARKIELPYIRKKDFGRGPKEYEAKNDYIDLPRKFKKPRVEYVIEPHTNAPSEQFVRDFFNGCQRCTSEEEVFAALSDIFSRPISDEEPSPIEKVKYCTYCEAENPLSAKFCQQCGKAEFEEDLHEAIRKRVRREDAEKPASPSPTPVEVPKPVETKKTEGPTDAEEQFKLGKKYYDEKNYAEAVKWYRKAAEQGNASAQFNLGFCYYYGCGVSKDYAEAVKWCRKVAKLGHAGAELFLGVCYENGNGVPQDFAEAAKWYQRSKEHGHLLANSFLEKITKRIHAETPKQAEIPEPDESGDAEEWCEKGNQCLVEKNYAEAVKWYRKAAKLGHAGAELFLGVCYENGNGVPQDFAEAAKWYQRSQEHGHPLANSFLEKITKRIHAETPKQEEPTKPALTLRNYPKKDFLIEGKLLTKYRGKGGDVVIPTGVKEIRTYAFCECKTLTSITIPDSVTAIGDCAFYGCTALTSISIPEGVTCIRGGVLCGCTALSEVSLPESVTRIEAGAFSGCTALTSITIPKNVIFIGDQPFSSCTSLEQITVSEGNPVYRSEQGCLIETKTNTLLRGSKNGVIPQSVTSIGDCAFVGCKSFTSVAIPNSVTSIGDCAFSGCTSLASITIPNSVTVIKNGAFTRCDALQTITLPRSVASIGGNLFENCPALTSLKFEGTMAQWGAIQKQATWRAYSEVKSIVCSDGTILPDAPVAQSPTPKSAPKPVEPPKPAPRPKTVRKPAEPTKPVPKAKPTETLTKYNKSEFEIEGTVLKKYKGKKANVTIPEVVTSIGGWAFSGCILPLHIIIPNSVSSIRGDAFRGCRFLRSITIPNSVTAIGDGAFSECKLLTSITIPNSVNSIRDYTFRGCESLTSITIPNSVTSIGSGVFSDCTSLTSLKFDGTMAQWKAIEKHKQWKDKSDIQSVICLDGSIFTVTLENYDKSEFWIEGTILKQYNDGRKKRVTIPEGVTKIRYIAFGNCCYLTSITIPNSVNSIEENVFSGCSLLKSLTYAGTMVQWKAIQKHENWRARSEIKSIICSDGTIFPDATATESPTPMPVETPKSAPVITLKNYDQSEFEIEGTVLTKYRGKKENVTIPEGVTEIGKGAFERCTSLTSITIPNSVTSIGDGAFYGCSSLKHLFLPGGLKTISPSLFQQSGIEDIAIPRDSATSIGENAFVACKMLSTVDIFEGVTSICQEAFMGCDLLRAVTIPKSVISIGADVFRGCKMLTSLKYLGTKKQWKAIAKHKMWKNDSAIKSVMCSDGVLTFWL